MNRMSGQIAWKSPSNIALIKYWGKYGDQLPRNPSLSMTLKKALTKTEMEVFPSENGLQLEYFFGGKQDKNFESKIYRYLQKINQELSFIKNHKFHFKSSNSFPHSAGIASSASSMSAVALCLVCFEELLSGHNLSGDAFFRRASYLARLGSGSASRSVYGGWTVWGKTDRVDGSDDRYAVTVPFPFHEKFRSMGDAVLLISSDKKQVASSFGHQLMDRHPFAEARYEQAKYHLGLLLTAMQVGDFEAFVSVVENEALTLHALLMTSDGNELLLKPNSLAAVEAVRKFRKQTGTEICFTFDAGPNVHLLYPMQERPKVLKFIDSKLIKFCEKGQWIDDETGNGPIKV